MRAYTIKSRCNASAAATSSRLSRSGAPSPAAWRSSPRCGAPRRGSAGGSRAALCKRAGIQFIDVIPNFLVTCPVHIPPLRFQYSWSNIARGFRGFFPCRTQNKFRNASVGRKSSRCWGPPGCRYRWRAERPQSVDRQRILRRGIPLRATKPLSARRRSPRSAWRHSISSTKKTPEHSGPAHDLPLEAAAVAAAVRAAQAVRQGLFPERRRSGAISTRHIIRSPPRTNTRARGSAGKARKARDYALRRADRGAHPLFVKQRLPV